MSGPARPIQSWELNTKDWMDAPGRVINKNSMTSTYACDPPLIAARIKKWADDRHAALVQRLAQ